ncbi:MAG: MarC family protein [Armatimonadota bacterium]
MNHDIIKWVLILIQSTMALLIVLDPFGLLPLVVGVTHQMTTKQRQRMLTRAVLIAFAMLLVFTFSGTAILRLFGIELYDLQIAGGLLLLVMALNIVIHGRMSSEPALDGGIGMGVVPIASPLLVGPGSITAAVVLVGTQGIILASLAVAIAFFLTWVVLRATTLIYKILGVTGSDVIARIMGILLAAIAIVYIRDGIFGILVAKGICK